jgi:hypothetical protein
MEPYVRSLRIDDSNYVPANHYQNNRISRETACYTCHTSYTMFGGVNAKLRGMRHLFVYYFTRGPEEIEYYDVYNNRECLHCHDGARSFEESVVHNPMLEVLKSNELSCLNCHTLMHGVAELDNLDLWQEEGSE